MLPSSKITPTNLADLMRSVAIHIGSTGQYARFKRMYGNDRIAFVYDCIPSFAKTMAPYQEDILGYFDDGYSRVSVRGPHGLGKTTLASILTQHSVLTTETDCKVVTTASAWRQLEKYLWPEIKKTGKFIDWLTVGRDPYNREELLSMSIKLNGGIVEAFAVASDDHTTIEGAHATRMVYIFDEAKVIPRPTWNAAEGAFSTEGLQVSEYQRGILPIKRNKPLSDLAGGLQEGNAAGIENGEEEEALSIGGEHSSKQSNSHHKSHSYQQQQSHSKGAASVSSNAFEHIEQTEYNAYESTLNLSTHELDTIAQQSSGADELQSNSRQLLSADKPDSKHVHTEHSTVKQTNALNADKSTVLHGLEVHTDKPHIQTARSIYEALAFAISTPGDPSGQFYDIHMKRPGYEDWKTRHVTVEEAIAAGRISAHWVEQRKLQWGETSSVYMNRVLGEFADNTEEGVIPLSWIRAAVQRWYEWERKGFVCGDEQDIRVLGVDVARAGEDKTVIAVRNGPGVSKIHTYSRLSSTSNAGHVRALCSGYKVHIEMDGGLGASVYDILNEQEVKNLVPITVSASTQFRDRSGEIGFINVRAAMWWHMREILDPAYNSNVCLPPVEFLIGDLSAPKWGMMKDAKVKLESKDSIAARIGRSTDYGDAVCLAFWQASRGGGVVF